MKSVFRLGIAPALIAFFPLALLSAPPAELPQSSDMATSNADVDGVNTHYLMAAHGPVVILLHGYTQTLRMWRPLISKLVDKFTVIAPDLPGIGDSDIPKDGLDMKNAAIRIHALAKLL